MSVFVCHSHQWGLPSGDQGMRSRSLDELQRQSWVLWHICDLCTETFTWCSQLWACDIIEGYLKFLKSVLSLPSQSKSCVQHNEISCEIFSAIVKFPPVNSVGKIQCLESTTPATWCWSQPRSGCPLLLTTSLPRDWPLARLLWGVGLSLTNGGNTSTLSKMHSNTVPNWPHSGHSKFYLEMCVRKMFALWLLNLC